MARVMIVDDAELMRMVIKETLMRHGHEVVAEMADGEEAFQKYQEIKPDLVLMDIITPSGEVVTSDINKEKKLEELLMDPNVKLIMCSSFGQRALITESMKIGAMGFMMKSFEPDEVMTIIKKIAEPN